MRENNNNQHRDHSPVPHRPGKATDRVLFETAPDRVTVAGGDSPEDVLRMIHNWG